MALDLLPVRKWNFDAHVSARPGAQNTVLAVGVVVVVTARGFRDVVAVAAPPVMTVHQGVDVVLEELSVLRAIEQRQAGCAHAERIGLEPRYDGHSVDTIEDRLANLAAREQPLVLDRQAPLQ